MDLASIKPVERIVTIIHPATRVETGLTVSLMSINDERMKKVRRRIQDERIRLQTRGKDFKAEDLAENGNQLIFAAMTGWEWGGDAKFHGEKPPFNQVNVIKVLEELPWFREQIEEAISDESAFFQILEADSKKPSASTPATK